jgi:hypothetical protein
MVCGMLYTPYKFNVLFSFEIYDDHPHTLIPTNDTLLNYSPLLVPVVGIEGL